MFAKGFDKDFQTYFPIDAFSFVYIYKPIAIIPNGNIIKQLK